MSYKLTIEFSNEKELLKKLESLVKKIKNIETKEEIKIYGHGDGETIK